MLQRTARFVNAQAHGPVRERSGEMCAETRMREIYNFWRRMDRESRIPNIRKLVQLVSTLTPSSAAAERAFSMLKHLFDLQQLQGGTLSDYVQAAVMARFRTGNLENEFVSVFFFDLSCIRAQTRRELHFAALPCTP